jgi:DNA-binding response OmpR family regulator
MESEARILFIDDEEQFADSMSEVLRREGFQVQAAYSGKTGLQMFVSGDFDLVITDLRMPEMDGIEVIGEIRRLRPAQRVIVVTAFPSQISQEQAFKLGTLSYIAKPFKPQRLIELVRDSLRADEGGLLGAVRLSPTDLIQLYSFRGETVVLEILRAKNGEVGRIYFERGKVVHAEAKKYKGKEAFHEIQSWESGIFETRLPKMEVPHTIEESVDALLLEGAHLQDENKPLSSKKGRGKKRRRKND